MVRKRVAPHTPPCAGCRGAWLTTLVGVKAGGAQGFGEAIKTEKQKEALHTLAAWQSTQDSDATALADATQEQRYVCSCFDCIGGTPSDSHSCGNATTTGMALCGGTC